MAKQEGDVGTKELHFGGFDAEAFWKDKPHKKRAVSLYKSTKKKQEHDFKLVQATTREGAIRTAKYYSMIDKPNRVFCRLAVPEDFM